MLKPFYQNETDIPEDQRGAYVAKGGRYELDELDKEHPVLLKNKELLATNSQLKSQASEFLQEKTRLESSILPEGKVAVDPDIEKLGNAAKAANLKAGEIPTLATKIAEQQTVIDAQLFEKTIDEVAADNQFNGKFKIAAKDKGLKFERTTEKVDGKELPVWNVIGADNTKTRVSEFIKQDGFFKEFADTFVDSNANQQTRKYTSQQPDGGKPNVNKFDAIRDAKQAEQKQITGNASIADRFYNRAPAAAE